MTAQVAATRDGRQGVDDKLSLLSAMIEHHGRREDIGNLGREIVAQSGARNTDEATRACYEFVAALPYVPEKIETFQSPDRTLRVGGDCDDQVILLGSILRSMAIPSNIVIAMDETGEGRHVYLETPDGVSLDTTAQSSLAWAKPKS